MTTTSTFQGMDSDGKPSSRVLNPPGGASNNIFGYNNEPVQKTPIRNNPDNVNRGNNDIFHQSPHAAAAQPKSRAPRSAFNPITGEPYDQPKATSQPQASAPEPAAVNNTNLDPSPGAVAAGVEEKPQEPQNDPAPQPAAAAAPAAQKRQQSGGSQIFGGGADDASQHRSTRVSQPPGGRSTKLW